VNKPLRILVADDNEDHRFFINRALDGIEGVNLIIESVADGAAVMALLRREGPYEDAERPNLVLLDLRMPHRNGLEVLAEMRADPTLRSIPVCVLTSSDRASDIQAAFDKGTNAYVVKSSDIDELRKRVIEVYDFYTSTSLLPLPPP